MIEVKTAKACSVCRRRTLTWLLVKQFPTHPVALDSYNSAIATPVCPFCVYTNTAMALTTRQPILCTPTMAMKQLEESPMLNSIMLVAMSRDEWTQMCVLNPGLEQAYGALMEQPIVLGAGNRVDDINEDQDEDEF